MRCRKAIPGDYQDIYTMGYDVWGDGLVKEEYLKFCAQSPKYKKGEWWVLEDNDRLVCSLIVYTFANNNYGIGSLATALNYRNKGYGSYLLKSVTNILKEEANGVFLYSDIGTSFYEKLGFGQLPERFQRYENSRCMYFKEHREDNFPENSFVPLEYF